MHRRRCAAFLAVVAVACGGATTPATGAAPKKPPSRYALPAIKKTLKLGFPRQLGSMLPAVKLRFEPKTTLKIRKVFKLKVFNLNVTRLTVGAHYDTNLALWRLDSTWQDDLIGGQLSLRGKELQLKKTWPLPLDGDNENFVLKLILKGAVDLTDLKKSHLRLTFRACDGAAALAVARPLPCCGCTLPLLPLLLLPALLPVAHSPPFPSPGTDPDKAVNILAGFPVVKRIRLDNHASLEVSSRVALPQPELLVNGALVDIVHFAKDKDGNAAASPPPIAVGMGDVEIAIEQINFCLDY